MAPVAGFVIEVEGEAVGLAMPDRDGVTFHAVDPVVQSLHGRSFPDTVDVVRAARSVLRRAA